MLVGAWCGFAGSNKKGTRTSRAVARALVVRGVVAGRSGLPQRLVPRHIVQASSHSLRRVVSGRRLLPLPLSRQTQPQTPPARHPVA